MNKNNYWIFASLALILATLACNYPAYSRTAEIRLSQTPAAITTPDPTEASLPTPLPESYFAGGAAKIPQSASQVSILILGSDTRNDGSFRTDVMILAVFNRLSGKISLVSFPRDLYGYLPGYGNQRFNTAQEFGGFELTQKTFEYHFGVRPDHYILTNFDGFKQILTLLGGVDIHAAKDFSDHCDLPGKKKRVCSVQAGENHLDADMALWYVRSRYSTSDFDRLQRTQEVLVGIFHQLISPENLIHAPQIYAQVIHQVETDMSMGDFVSLLPTIIRLNTPGNLNRVELTAEGGQVSSWVDPESGAYLLLPNPDKIREVLVAAYSR